MLEKIIRKMQRIIWKNSWLKLKNYSYKNFLSDEVH